MSQTQQCFPSISWKLFPDMLKLCAGIYAFKTRNEEEWGDYNLFSYFGIIMMIKSLLESYSKQWYGHRRGDSLSADCPCSLLTFPHS